jgi:hypothetical protein
LVWNLGFWPDPELREVACVLAYEEAMARLFEGMVLLRFGYVERVIEIPDGLGKVANFGVTVNVPGRVLVDKHLPNQAAHLWEDTTIRFMPDCYRLRFRRFFDWYQLAPRDFLMLEVLIERLDEQPELAGHLALLQFEQCSIWLSQDDSPSNESVVQ